MKRIMRYLKKKGNKTLSIYLVLFIILFITLACSLPFKIVWITEENEKTDQANTAIAELLITEEPQDNHDQDTSEDEAAPVEDELPSKTLTNTPSPTTTDTPKPEKVTAQINKNTNCRIGPKDVYELIHIFLNGDQVELKGKNQTETFWYVVDQESGEIECWIWNEYATADGDIGDLPVFTPPPEPAPIMSFVVSYNNTSGETVITVYVRNTGNVALQSYSATFKDIVSSEMVAVSGNKFGNAAKVSVGNTGVVSSSPFSASTIGHQINVSVKACSLDGQAGKCFTASTSFESK